jgi:hypothetical protein
MKHVLLALVASLALVACSDSVTDPKPDLTIPTQYDSTSWRSNAATELGVQAALSNLAREMQKGRTPGTRVESATLMAAFAALRGVTTSYYAGQIDQWIPQMAASSGGTFDPRKPAAENGQGGTFGAYLFDEHGIEIEQLIEKGLFTAAQYNHALTVMAEAPSVAAVDRVLAVYGAHPGFANSGTSGKLNRDFHSAVYAARRSDTTDQNSLYLRIKHGLLKARAAAAAGPDYATQYAEAMADVRLNWERAIMATVVNYLYSAIDVLKAGNPDDAKLAGAMHAYAEGLGFLHGWKTIPANRKVVPDATVDALLNTLGAPVSGTPSTIELFANPAQGITAFDSVINSIKALYGFTDAEMEGFKVNWVSSQRR